jgi:uncharacterized phage infection (PIP) family protein YhgE
MSNKSETHLGKKILYAFVIALCVLVIVVSVTGMIGALAVRRPLSDAAIAVLSVVEDASRTAQQAASRVDQATEKIQSITLEIAKVSDQIGQNVSDKGLVLTLLPAEQEQELLGTIGSIKETFLGIREAITAGLELYRSIDRLPFVNLPGPSEDQMLKIESSISRAETLVETLRSAVEGFRSGVTSKIDQVANAASSLTNEIQQIREQLSQLNSKLASLEALSIRLQEIIPGIFMTLTIILSLFLAFLIYTQVEVIRLFITRWRRLG